MSDTRAHRKIVFAGDSITACGKSIDHPGSLGSGYVGLFSDLTRIRKPGYDSEIINSGIDGNTIGHLLSRWNDDVLAHHPDIVVVLIGINDALRLYEKMSSYHLPPDKFQETYRMLITETRQKLPATRLLLAEPFYLTTRNNPSGSYRNGLAELVDKYIKATRSVADEFALPLCETNALFFEILGHNPVSFLSNDCIHLTRAGHLALAEGIHQSLFGPANV